MAQWNIVRDKGKGHESLVLGGVEAETGEQALSEVVERLEAVYVGANCRYCKHLVDVRPKGTRKYVGACEYGLRPQDCGKFEDMRAG